MLSSTERTPNFPSRCSLDGSDVFKCGGSPPGTLAGLCDGPHLLSARSLDESGNVDPTPALRAFSITGSTPCAAPQLGAPTAGGLVPTQAQVTAPLTTGGAPVTVTLRYGTTAAYGELARRQIAPNSVGDVNVGLQGLKPGTTYHYDVSAASTVGAPAASGDRTFATPALGVGEAPPAVDVGTPLVAGRHAARIPITTDVGAPASGLSVTVYLDDHGPVTLASPFAFHDDGIPVDHRRADRRPARPRRPEARHHLPLPGPRQRPVLRADRRADVHHGVAAPDAGRTGRDAGAHAGRARRHTESTSTSGSRRAA